MGSQPLFREKENPQSIFRLRPFHKDHQIVPVAPAPCLTLKFCHYRKRPLAEVEASPHYQQHPTSTSVGHQTGAYSQASSASYAQHQQHGGSVGPPIKRAAQGMGQQQSIKRTALPSSESWMNSGGVGIANVSIAPKTTDYAASDQYV